MSPPIFRTVILLIAFFIRATSAFAAEPDFAREIRPLLARNCFDCHGAKKAKGDVRFGPPREGPTDPKAMYGIAAKPNDFTRQVA